MTIIERLSCQPNYSPSSSMESVTKLHVALFPWLAVGHLIPFFQLSKLLAEEGNTIFFISTPRNLQRLPKIPTKLSSKINLISIPLPRIPDLPPFAESSNDVTYNQQILLKQAFDLLQSPLTVFLESSKPDWVIYDYAAHWLPPVAASLHLPRAFFSLFTAAFLSYAGPPAMLINGEDSRVNAEDFTLVPKWIPFKSNIAFHLHEVAKYVERTNKDADLLTDNVRLGLAVEHSDVVIVRSSPELEPEYFDLLADLYKKPTIPVGFLPPSPMDADGDFVEEQSASINEWLDGQKTKSVIYVALGTEVDLSEEELFELAIGLEKSTCPFFWVLRNSPEPGRNVLDSLPEGFSVRVQGRGLVHVGWAPQVAILRHNSVGAFLTHCGWNSVVEGLSFGRVLVLLPFLNDQGLNARLLQGKKIGLEIPRKEIDGSFTSDAVAESVRLALGNNGGDQWLTTATDMQRIATNPHTNRRMSESLITFLQSR